MHRYVREAERRYSASQQRARKHRSQAKSGATATRCTYSQDLKRGKEEPSSRSQAHTEGGRIRRAGQHANGEATNGEHANAGSLQALRTHQTAMFSVVSSCQKDLAGRTVRATP